MVHPDPINIIIVGAGFSGFSSAIELARKGFKVRLFEANLQLPRHGDLIMLSSNATRVMKTWGDTLKQLPSISAQPARMEIQDQHGKHLLTHEMNLEFGGYPTFWASRVHMARLMYDFAVSLGVEFIFGKRITKYWEGESGAGVYIGDEKLSADLVVAADGMHSKARLFVTGVEDRAQKSGYAVYRCRFPIDALRNDPVTRDLATSGKDTMHMWLGQDVHSIVITDNNLQSVTTYITHKDDYTIEESWSFPGTTKDMLITVDGWDPLFRQIVKKIPEDLIVDFKLLWRDPVMDWVSPKGHIILVGDAAHPHLPTSGNGGGQAMEDGATLAAVLDRAGRTNIPIALKAFEKLRFERTCLTQRLGWEMRHKYHQTDWKAYEKNPDFLALPQPAWLYGSDAESYGYDNYDAVVSHLKNGTPFRNSNVPEDYVHEDWTVESMMKKDLQQGQEAMYVIK